MKEIKMDFGFKVRVNTRAEQVDTFNKMELRFRNGATQSEYLSMDYHVPKYIILDIANKALVTTNEETAENRAATKEHIISIFICFQRGLICLYSPFLC